MKKNAKTGNIYRRLEYVMRILVCGSRYWKNRDLIKYQLKKYMPETVIEGEAKGADTIVREEAEKLNISVEKYLADWKKYGRAAGPIRNKEMLDKGKPDLIIAFHNSLYKSKGTINMIKQAQKAHIKYIVINEETV